MAVSFKQLCELLDCKQAASLKRVMKARGIKWSLDRNGKPWTTETELDRALSAEKRVLTFTRPPCRQKKQSSRSPQVSEKNTAPGISSRPTGGPSYAE